MRMVLNLDRPLSMPIAIQLAPLATAAVLATTVPASVQAQAASLPGDAPVPQHEVERTAFLMGTRAVATVRAGHRAEALKASEAALDAISAAEDLLSTWREDTELARINRAAPGEAVQPDPRVAALLREVAGWSRRTSGAFHPAVGSLIDAWDLRGQGRVPSTDELCRALGAAGDAGISIDPGSGAVARRDSHAWLDAGAFGKGAALRDARAALMSAGISSARLDLGGQLLLMGEKPVTVAVAHPDQRQHPLYHLTVADASVATSGQSERGIDVAGVRYGHLLDPRSGRPVPPWGSVTVVHPDPLVADILATALFVLGPDAGLELAESLDGVAALFLSSDGEDVTERMTSAMERHHPLRSEAPLGGS